MGLIKKDYDFKGFKLEEVYARVKVNTSNNTATFYLGKDREMAFVDPIEKITINVVYTHTKDPRVEAYEFAKGKYETEEYNVETNKYERVLKYREFFGWKDDLVGE